MPRIEAPRVAEHHARQRRALLDAAHALLAETGEAPSMAAVGRRAGLARSSVYQYFDSPGALLHAVVTDVFPTWMCAAAALAAAVKGWSMQRVLALGAVTYAAVWALMSVLS